MVVNSVKHSSKSPVTLDYHANSVTPARYVVYRKVTGTYRLDSFGIEFGVVTVDNMQHCVVRHVQSNGQWSQWESLTLAVYLN